MKGDDMNDHQTALLIQALAPIVGTLVTALVKWLVPQLPKLAQPLLAIAAGAVTASVGGASPELAMALGGSAVAVRETVDRAKKAAHLA